ncbi:hypothetical protein BpHYR1_042804 [Brachionus plicatilis]|uniref:Uncharacterized protein n=1 Tax=Brachionus plicatilis TaxID=10195 RepID=A0A3M7SQG5_BRAPC|nr:hypothetical protein BpHYR1_042804 [Brachionus plicatilis]
MTRINLIIETNITYMKVRYAYIGNKKFRYELAQICYLKKQKQLNPIKYLEFTIFYVNYEYFTDTESTLQKTLQNNRPQTVCMISETS